MSTSTSIDESSLNQPYASIDVSAFDPLLIDATLVEATAKTFAKIPLSEFPLPFLETWSTFNSNGSNGLDKSWCEALDQYDPSRVFANALRASVKPRTGVQLTKSANLSTNLLSTDTPTARAVYLRGIAAMLKECTEAYLKCLIETDGKKLLPADVEQKLNEKLSQAGEVAGSAPAKWNEQWKTVAQRAAELETTLAKYIQILVKTTPVGLMHRYRQHFFYGKLVNGPVELIRTLAPNEELEVVLTESTESTREDQFEQEIEVTQTQSTEQKTTNELTERVSRTVAMTATTNISAQGSYTAIFWSGGGSAATSTSNSSSQTNETMARRLQEITTKQSEQVRKKSRVSTRTVDTRNSSNLTRHVVKNTSNDPVSFGMKKLGYNVKSVIQDLGPYMVWQTEIHKPGRSLALAFHQDLVVRSADVAYYEKQQAQDNRISIPIIFASRGNEGGFGFAMSVAIDVGKPILDAINDYFDGLQKDPLLRGRPEVEECRRVNIESLSKFTDPNELCASITGFTFSVDSDHGTNDAHWVQDALGIAQPSINSHVLWNYGAATVSLTAVPWFNLYVRASLKLKKVPYLTGITFVPGAVANLVGSGAPIDIPVAKYVSELLELKAVQKGQADSEKPIRAVAGLRYEERKTILANIYAQVADGTFQQTGLTDDAVIRYFQINQIFDTSMLFYDVDTFEWKEAASIRQGWPATKPAYPVHSEATGGAHIGASLGWSHQIDADFRRDMFLNAPFAWACLPVRPGMEIRAIEFLRDQQVLLSAAPETDKLAKQLYTLRLAASKFIPANVISQQTADLSKVEENSAILVSAKNARKWLDDETLLSKSEKELEEYFDGNEWTKLGLKAKDVYPIISYQENFAAIEGLAAEVLSFGGDTRGEKSDMSGSNETASLQMKLLLAISLLLMILFVVMVLVFKLT